jgi:hypothetical protein
MNDPRMNEKLDALTVQIHDWTESALSLDEGHFPSELLSDLEDLIDELKNFLEDAAGQFDRRAVTEPFVTPEMGDVIERFPRVRKLLERAWGAELMEQIEEEASGFAGSDDEED